MNIHSYLAGPLASHPDAYTTQSPIHEAAPCHVRSSPYTDAFVTSAVVEHLTHWRIHSYLTRAFGLKPRTLAHTLIPDKSLWFKTSYTGAYTHT